MKNLAHILLAVVLSTACAPSELTLIDQANLTTLDEVHAWVDLIAEVAPDPARVRDAADHLTVEVEPRPRVRSPDHDGGYPYGVLDGSYALLAWQTCSQGHPTGSILTHVLGHKLGYDHRDAAWFGVGGVEQQVVQALCPSVTFGASGLGYVGRSAETFEAVTALAVTALARVYPDADLAPLLALTRVVEDPALPDGFDGASMPGLITLRPHACAGDTSLAHELAHLAALSVTGDGDGQHHDTRLFLDGCKTNACAYATVELVGRGLCE